MALRTSAFPNWFVAAIHAIGWVLIVPCFWFLDRFIASWKSTTLEKSLREEQECYLHPLEVFFSSILFFILFLIACPFAFIGFLLWAPLQACRRPFSYHRETKIPEKESNFKLTEKTSFGFATANLCLLPDSVARFNNLGHTQRRATAIGQRIAHGVHRPQIRIIVESPSSCGTLSPSVSILSEGSSPCPEATSKQIAPAGGTYGSTDNHNTVTKPANVEAVIPNSDMDDQLIDSPTTPLNSNQNSNQQDRPRALLSRGHSSDDNIIWEMSSLFPTNLDVICLEEVFDKRAAQKLITALKPVFGHILYDVGVYACQPPCKCSTFKFFNSGLFVASRFPVLQAQFHFFPNSRGEDALAAKGLLATKLLIGKNERQKDVVGFFNCTHLHAPEGEGVIRCIQLDMVTKWIADFQAANTVPDEDVVFDVLCGDFNFDNCSPDDTLEQNHSLFEMYIDPCRAGPGKEKPWVSGTLLEQPTLYEEDVNSPDSLQRTLGDEKLRKQYISPPVPAAGQPLVYPENGQPWIGRRIDYILYRQSSLSKHYKTEIEEVHFITHLAGLIDHIPVSVRLGIKKDVEDTENIEE
ncbi:sphingomyelin phosphodiesterase 5 [Periophthalmus magnuspinnatus]|uniref:sphingomyelin phosphodiesterase 5 n=1 Tax=Periophthalmus magnuspinnatus TaxID=409849 RepID=UPI00145B91D0|nr:sphingomyelin phosphodiesterase 5 [Periophthalmus magnuspinnatus]XP_055083809.1 sphingomyelin phosphodiesterase 5 [Periophthalmus magnuspinnatus]